MTSYEGLKKLLTRNVCQYNHRNNQYKCVCVCAHVCVHVRICVLECINVDAGMCVCEFLYILVSVYVSLD